MKVPSRSALAKASLVPLALAILCGCTTVTSKPAPVVRSIHNRDAKVENCAPLATPDNRCSVQPGTGSYLLVAGTVLTPERIYAGGGVLITPEGIIDSVGCDVFDKARALQSTQVICPSGVVSPGLVNAHDHITYDQNPPSDWGTERYDRRNEWRKGSHDHKPITPKPMPGASGEQTAWSELRHLMAGTTSIAGSGGYKGLLRNLDRADLLEGLGTDYVYYSTFPLGDSSNVTPHIGDCNYPKLDNPGEVLIHQCYLPHLAEGVDLAANNEIRCLDAQGLISSKGTYIHSIAALGRDGELLKDRGASVVWSPRSNISLYGNTAQVTMYSASGLNIALSTDWTPSGSMNLLRELKCADLYNKNNLNSFFGDRELWMMVTANPADALHLDKQIGRLAPGLVADVAVFDGSGAINPYRAILDADVKDVLLVLRSGIPLYGENNIASQRREWLDGCERYPGGVNGADKIVCIQRELGEDFATLQRNNTSSYPLFFAGPPAGEPTCIPSRPAIAGKEAGYAGIPVPGDMDGDGVPDAQDNCRTIFNPIRPVDAGVQADCNGNGIGDPCDQTPCM